jgi:hypothetical protein
MGGARTVAAMFGSSEDTHNTFLIRPGESLYRAQIEAHALAAWRRAEKLVHERWSEYLGAEKQARAGAFAAYTTALEVEGTAARRLEAALPAVLSEAA